MENEDQIIASPEQLKDALGHNWIEEIKANTSNLLKIYPRLTPEMKEFVNKTRDELSSLSEQAFKEGSNLTQKLNETNSENFKDAVEYFEKIQDNDHELLKSGNLTEEQFNRIRDDMKDRDQKVFDMQKDNNDLARESQSKWWSWVAAAFVTVSGIGLTIYKNKKH